MGDNTKIMTLDAQIMKLRQEIEATQDKTCASVISKQREVDKLIEARYALLLKMQNQTSASQGS